MNEHALTDDDFRELDDLLEALLEVRANPPDGMTAADLPSLFDLAGGDQPLLALLEHRFELAQARVGTEGTA